MASAVRLNRERLQLVSDPPDEIAGPDGTPYSGGVFELEIEAPERYPLEPPRFRFVTPIYHPNVDASGRICLDTLKMPPVGSWSPALSLTSVLTTVRLLLAEPNYEDAVMAEIAAEHAGSPAAFAATCRAWVRRHAQSSLTVPGAAAADGGAAGAAAAAAAAPHAVAPAAVPAPPAAAAAAAPAAMRGVPAAAAADRAVAVAPREGLGGPLCAAPPLPAAAPGFAGAGDDSCGSESGSSGGSRSASPPTPKRRRL